MIPYVALTLASVTERGGKIQAKTKWPPAEML